MKIPIVKKLVESYTLDELQAADEAISEEKQPDITIEGDDEGEQLTHAFAAVWIKQKMEDGIEFRNALREYTQMVRNSIS